MQAQAVRVVNVDYSDPVHAQALACLLDQYARDPMGGGEALPATVLNNLAQALARRADAFSVLAFSGDTPVGLVNCFEGFSTFACQPLGNIHDVVVVEGYRGQGIAQQMLVAAEAIARQRGCCKMTMEVLEGNGRAQAAYRKLGYGAYELDPAMGKAMFWQKAL